MVSLYILSLVEIWMGNITQATWKKIVPSLKYTIISFHTFSLIDKSNPSSIRGVCHI